MSTWLSLKGIGETLFFKSFNVKVLARCDVSFPELSNLSEDDISPRLYSFKYRASAEN